MAKAAETFEEVHAAPPAAERPARLPGHVGQRSGESPAIDLQKRVAAAFESRPDRWSGRKTLLFIMAVCGVSWTCILIGLRVLLA